MINFLKKTSYKLLITLMVTIELSFFLIAPYSNANDALKIGEGEYYYRGAQNGEISYDVDDKNAFEKILDAGNIILGILMYAVKGSIIGWVEIAERILTKLLTLDEYIKLTDDNMMEYSQTYINVETILFNRVKILDANIFNYDDESEGTTGEEEEETFVDEETTTKLQTIVNIIRETVAKLYYILLIICVAFMLILLIYIGIKMALSTIASQKALYKQMLVGWISGMALMFVVPYIMVAVLNINEGIVTALEGFVKEETNVGEDELEEYQYGDDYESAIASSTTTEKSTDDIETSLYETARTRAYSIKFTDGFVGMIMYSMLVYYAWRYAIIYFKRMLNIVFLTLISPVIVVKYSYDKSISGKGNSFSIWLKEYIMNVIIQIVHIIIYVSFVSISMILALQSIVKLILAIVILKFMIKAGDMLKRIFKLTGGGGLSEELESKSSPDEVFKESKAIFNSVVGGKAVKKGIKAAYKTAYAPIKYASEQVFGNIMERRANKDLEKRNEIEQQNQEMEKIEKAIQQSQQAQQNEQAQQIEQAQQNVQAQQEDIYSVLNDKLPTEKETMDEIRKANTGVKIVARNAKKAFNYHNYVKPIRDENGKIISYKKKKTRYVFDTDLELRDIANKSSKKKSRRQKRRAKVYRQLTRKISGKESSIGMKYKSLMNFNALVGFNDDSKAKKEFENEFKDYKKILSGTIQSFFVVPMMAISPVIALKFATDGSAARMKAVTYIRKNKSSYERDYVFKRINDCTEDNIKSKIYAEMDNDESKMNQECIKKHKKLFERIIKNAPGVILRGGIAVAGTTVGVSKLTKTYKVSFQDENGNYIKKRKVSGIRALYENPSYRFCKKKGVKKAYARYRKELIDEYAEKYTEAYYEMREMYEEEEAEKILEIPDSKIREEDNIFFASETIFAGNKTVELYRINGEDAIYREVENIVFNENNDAQDRISESNENAFDENNDAQRRINNAKEFLKGKSDEIIERSLIKICVESGQYSVNQIKISFDDEEKIKDDFIKELESKGIIKKGEIKAKDIGITHDKIEIVKEKLQREKEKTNDKLEKELLFQTCIEHVAEEMKSNPIKIDLPSDEAKQKIKLKVESKKRKKTTEVIYDLNQAKAKETGKEIDLSEAVFELSNDEIGEIDKIFTGNTEERKISLSNMRKKAKNRRSNALEEELERRLYNEESGKSYSGLDVRAQRMQEVLGAIKELNVEKQKVENKVYRISLEEERKMNRYGVESSNVRSTYTKMHGSAKDVVKLIRIGGIK